MIIGLCGRPTSGKGEVARILESNYGFEILDTKKLLRDITGLISGIEPDSLKKQETKALYYKEYELRHIMGSVGCFLEKTFGEDFLLQRALQGVDLSRNIVIDGLRRNQAWYCKELIVNGVILEVDRPGVEVSGYSFDEYDREVIDYTIDNSGTLLDLRDKVDHFMRTV